MLTAVVLPQMGLEVTEATVVALHVQPGATVAAGDPLLEVETDKAVTDVEAPRDGVVAGFAVAEGDVVPVGATLLHLADTADEAAGAPPAAVGAPAAATPDEPAGATPAAATPSNGSAPSAATTPAAPAGTRATLNSAGRIKAAPIARRAAEKLGVELAMIAGTGPRGRITLGDVEAAHAAGGPAPEPQADLAPPAEAAMPPAPPPAPAPAPAGGGLPGERLEPMSATRRAIARRMTESQQIPQFTLEREVDATWLLAEKVRLADPDPAVRIGVNDLLVQALAETLLLHRDLAASFVAATAESPQPQLRRRDGVDVGLAVAGDRGLLVPVIRRADERTLREIATERKRLVAAARTGRLDLAEMTGATVSLSSLASFGVDRFTAMLNPGETSILAVGRTVDRVVPRGRDLVVVPTMSLTLTLDHRVADGATGAAALAELATLLEGGMVWRT